MSEPSVAFLVCGLLMSGNWAWGLVTGKMLSHYFVADRQGDSVNFWISAVLNAIFALVCFYMVWADF